MFDIAINADALQHFKERLHGELIGPSDEGYESARRVWMATEPAMGASSSISPA